MDMPAAFPSDFQYTFKTHDSAHAFPPENREQMGETQVTHFNFYLKNVYICDLLLIVLEGSGACCFLLSGVGGVRLIKNVFFLTRFIL